MSEKLQNQRPVRIVHCLRAPVGGLFRHVYDIARAQSLSGCEVGILCADEPNDPPTIERLSELNSICKLGVKRISLGRLPGVSDVRALVSGGKNIAQTRPDIIHGHGAKGGLLARLVYAPGAAARVYTPHGGSIHYAPHSFAGRVFGLAERLMLRRTDGLIFESEFARSVFADRFGVLPVNTAVVHNGVAADEFDPVPLVENFADFVFLGELRALKGIFTLLDAFDMLSTRMVTAGRQVTLAIVGDGPDAAALRARISGLGLGANVRLLGAMPARSAFAQGGVVVMPSHRDSFPYVALEAAAAGRPLVATRTGGIPEIFGPYSGELVTPGDATELAVRMGAVLDDRVSLSRTARQMQERVRCNFSAEKMAAEVLDVYRSAMRAKVGGTISGAPRLDTPISMDVAK